MNLLSTICCVVMARLASAAAEYNDLAILSPSEKDCVQIRHLQRIQWVPSSQVKCVSLELCSGPSENLLTESVIAKSITNSGKYMWNVPYVDTSKMYAIRITDVGKSNITNYSPQFRIHSSTHQINGAQGNSITTKLPTSTLTSKSTTKPIVMTSTSMAADTPAISIRPLTRSTSKSKQISSPSSQLTLSSTSLSSSPSYKASTSSDSTTNELPSSKSSSSQLQLSATGKLTSTARSSQAVSLSTTSLSSSKSTSRVASTRTGSSAYKSTSTAGIHSKDTGDTAVTSRTSGANRPTVKLLQLVSFLSVVVWLF